jgi:hypothetical protein
MVNHYQERVDRETDDIFSHTYHVPLVPRNRVQPDGVTRKVFPGSVTMATLYWTAGTLLLNEFQQLSQNLTDQANSYVEMYRRQIHALAAFMHRLRGQELRSNISNTMPPSLQPPRLPEANF